MRRIKTRAPSQGNEIIDEETDVLIVYLASTFIFMYCSVCLISFCKCVLKIEVNI